MESRQLRISTLLLLVAFAFPLLNGCAAVVSDAKMATSAMIKLQKSREKRNMIATTMDDRSNNYH